jgi:hypothetical protein
MMTYLRRLHQVRLIAWSPPLPAALDYFLLVDFDCAGGGRPTFFAGIRQVAQVRIV